MVSLCARLLLQKRESLSSEVREKLVTGSKEEALARAGTKYVPEESKLPTGAIVWLKFDGEKLSQIELADNSSVTSWGTFDQWAAKFSLPGGVQLVIKTFRSLKKADPNYKTNYPTAEEAVQRNSDEYGQTLQKPTIDVSSDEDKSEDSIADKNSMTEINE